MKKHIYTIVLICLMVLAVWLLGLIPAQAFIGGGGGSGGGGSGGGLNPGTAGNPVQYATSSKGGPVANIFHAGSGTLAAAFTALGSNPGIVIADPGQTYTVSSPLTWGTSNDQTLLVYGQINCTDTTGGRDCLDVDVHGHLVGAGPGDASANNGCVITDASTANITSLVTNASHSAGDGFDFRNCQLSPNTSSTITKGELWLSGAQGFNTVDNVRFNQPPVGGSNSGIEYAVDDDGGAHQWNQIDNEAVSVTCSGAAGATGINISVSSSGAQPGGSNFTFLGGSVVDCGTTSKLVNIVGNSTNQVKNVKFVDTYFEPGAPLVPGTGDFIDITDAYGVDFDDVYFNQANSSTMTNCVSISGQAGNTGIVHVSGRSAVSACTNVINNAISGYTKTASGNLDYTYTGSNGSPIKIVDGPSRFNSFGPLLYFSAAGTAIPSCAAALAGQFACTSDSTACTSGTTYASGGSTGCLLQCNNAGSAWKETGLGCF